MGFTAVQNIVCLSLLEFCLPAINPEFVMECTLTAHPMLDRVELPGSISIHFLSRMCKVHEDEQVVEGLLVVVVLLVDQVCDQFVQALRHSDPRMRIVFVHRLNSDFHSIIYLVGNRL